MKYLQVKSLSYKLSVFVICMGINGGGCAVKAEEIELPKALQNTEWKIADWRSASDIWSGGGEIRAKKEIGKTIRLHINSGMLENGKECPVQSVEHESLTDGSDTFGTGGGSWSKLGFVAEGGVYPITRVRFDCGKDDWPQRDIIYSEKDDVFVRDSEMELMLKRIN